MKNRTLGETLLEVGGAMVLTAMVLFVHDVPTTRWQTTGHPGAGAFLLLCWAPAASLGVCYLLLDSAATLRRWAAPGGLRLLHASAVGAIVAAALAASHPLVPEQLPMAGMLTATYAWAVTAWVVHRRTRTVAVA